MFIFALCYLILPVFLVLFTFFSTPFVISSSVALVILIFCLQRSQQLGKTTFCLQAHNLAKYWPLLLVSLIATYFCVVSPFDSWDWQKHYAFFNLLSGEGSWPPVIEFNGHTWFLRHHLAWYIVPTLLTKIFGSQLLTASLFIWTTTGLFVALMLAFHNLNKTKHLFVAALVFLFFSGLDIVGAWLTSNITMPSISWLQWWAGEKLFGTAPTLICLQYSPHHILVAWVVTCLFLYNRRLATQNSMLIIIVSVLWSSFCVIGFLPIAIWALYKEGYRTALTPQNLLVAPLLAIPILFYATQEAGQIPHMFIWEDPNFIFSNFIIFFLIEFLLIQIFLCYLVKEGRELLFTITSFIFVICFLKMGYYNDLLTRVSMPVVCILSIWSVKALLENRGWRREALIGYLLVGALPAVVSLVMAVKPSTPRVDKSMTLERHFHIVKPSPYIGLSNYTSYFLAKTTNVATFFSIPLLRNLPGEAQPQVDTSYREIN